MPKILFHFGELSLKGKNRSEFERRMARNIRQVLRPVLVSGGFHREHGRMLAEVRELSDALLAWLALIPGIRNFSIVHEAPLELSEIQRVAAEAVLADHGADVAGRPFRVTARRGNKAFALTSPELNFEVGGYLKARLGLKVCLDAPEIEVHVEIGKRSAYIYTRKIAGIGGLPVGSSGHGMVLFSGGIDSPVAAYAMMKRGMRVSLVHCYNSTINRDFGKIHALARQLSRYQGALTLHCVDLDEFQRHAIALVPAEYRMIIYKRQMIREAVHLAEASGAMALVTGDSLGQVASQTLANIHAIYDASPLPLLSPLIAWDKEEIIALARRIGTFALSLEEYCDICSFLIAKHPETRGKRHTVATLEAELPIDTCRAPVRTVHFHAGEEADG
ncbi:MAG: tRNA 4-thiouridine(8) synthase ThiI [Zetaproteobacteria bacterium]|nr:MAG: tRNA 4-thiouridine(8) synthase ThiI [Zetaproteobacteria bacterium]